MDGIFLRHGICSVDGRTYGGSQMLSDDKNVKKCGCGVVAAADLIIYLHRYHSPFNSSLLKDIPDDGAIPLAEYRRLLTQLNRRFFPLIPSRGINGVVLTAGLNLFFRLGGGKMTAIWCVSGGKMWERSEDMLRRDLPVIFSVGMNFPKFWGKEKLRLYTKLPDGTLRPSGSVRAHFMTMTGMDSEYIRVSSWGRMYYISKAEFDEYVRKNSGSIICNIVYITGMQK